MSKNSDITARKAYPYEEAELNTFDGKTMKVDGNKYERNIFRSGYECAEQDFGWHDAGNSQPPIDEEVIVLTDNLKISFGHIVDKNNAVDYDGWNIPGVKYWMPCPNIPEE